jgi:HAE1 family hydrophobic/amphiphilic exporter-1
VKHTELALRRPVTTVMTFVALSLIGLVAVRLLPLEKFPDIQFPGIFVQVPYPGSTPEEVERQITRPIEEALATLSGVARMRSTSTQDQAEIFLEFDWGEDVSAKGIEARAKVDAIRADLPADVERVIMFTGSFGDQPILNLRISSARDLSDSYDMLDRNLKRPMERVEGVSRVELYGVDPKEIRILLNADRVAAHGVDLNELRNLLEKANFSVSAGRMTDGQQRFSVRPIGELGSLQEVKDILVRENLRLDEIADVELRTPDRNYGRHLDRSYAIGLDIYKQPGANLVDVAQRVLKTVEAARDTPQMSGINIFELESQAQGVTSSLSDLTKSGAIGAALAFIVLFLFLRQVATTVIVVLSVPFSVLITFGFMYFMDISLNILSMMGLMLAVGMLVDNAVVVTESIFRYRQMMPDDPIKATIMGVREVGLAVVAGTATSIIVFVPILWGTQTDITVFLTHVAVSIVVAMIASLVIAQTLVPMLASRIPPPPPTGAGTSMGRLIDRYVRALDWTLTRRWKTAGLIVLTIASVAIPIKLVKFDTFPQEAGRKLFMQFNLEGKYPLAKVEGAVDTFEEYLFSHKEELNIRSVYSYFDEGRAQTMILLTDEDQATIKTKDIIDHIEKEMPDIVIGKPSFDLDQQGGQEGFSLQIMGESTEELAKLSPEVARILETVEGLEDVRSDVGTGDWEIQISVDRDRASQLGLSPQEVADAVAVALRGQKLRDFRGSDGEVDVRLAFRESDRQSLEQLADIPLFVPGGQRTRLGAVADFSVERAVQEIKRVDRQTAAVVSATLNDISLDDVKPTVEKLMDNFNFPPGYSWKFGRGFERSDETQQIMAQNILLGIALIFIVMAALFESALYPLSIITSIGFSVVGVFWFFLLTNTTFSFMASIGIMILIGVVVNNGIVLVDHINNLRREGMPRDEAILQAGRDRLRPILMTVATTILGLLPLAISTTKVGGDDVGAPPYFPMARAIIGGLGFSSLTSLLLVPYLYATLDDLNRWSRKVMRVARSRAPARTPAVEPGP